MKVIKTVAEPEWIEFDGGAGMWRFDLTFTDGTDGVAWRHPDIKKFPPKVGDEGNVDAKGKFTKPKKDEGGGGWSQGGDSSDKMRSKEQCMRGEAIQAAACIAPNKEEALKYAAEFYDWIKGDDAPAPAPAGMTLEEARQKLAECGVEMAAVAQAVEAVTGQKKLTDENIGQVDAIIAKAKSLDDIPF